MDTKKFIAPLQRWLLSQGRCVACGRPLEGGRKESINGVVHVTCDCRRIFIFNPEEQSYRRALFKEI